MDFWEQQMNVELESFCLTYPDPGIRGHVDGQPNMKFRRFINGSGATQVVELMAVCNKDLNITSEMKLYRQYTNE